jgi:Ca-activated chloride channel family protein
MKRILAAALVLAACEKGGGGGGEAGSKRPAPSPNTAPVELVVVYGSEKKTWLEESAKKFMAEGGRTKGDRPIQIVSKAMGSGEAQAAILDGSLKPHVFSPASGAYVTLLNDAWLAKGNGKPLSPAGEPVVLSPVVIAMWKPMAEALGWPEKAIGWGTLLGIAADPKGWGKFDRPEWGRLKLGHTHPEHSNSGLLAVLAEAYAGSGKTRGLAAADLDDQKTRDFLSAVEGTMVHYGKSTGFFTDKMLERGPKYLSAAVSYENLVVESYSKQAPMPLVAVYPEEGTFWSDHPYAILDAPWVGAPEREAAEAFLAYLKAKPQQERALALGFRPADATIAIGAPLDLAHGVDPKQPQTLLEIPDAATLGKLVATWRELKKAADVIFVFDKSGSMEGEPLAAAKQGAKAFFQVLSDKDEVTLVFFDSEVYPPTEPVELGKGRAKLESRIDATIADGGTALYDAVSVAFELGQKRAKAEPGRIHAVVVLTDGRDESSKLAINALLAKFSDESAPVKVFTIAYGTSADPEILTRIADKAKGSFSTGDTKNIKKVYEDMGSFF